MRGGWAVGRAMVSSIQLCWCPVLTQFPSGVELLRPWKMREGTEGEAAMRVTMPRRPVGLTLLPRWYWPGGSHHNTPALS